MKDKKHPPPMDFVAGELIMKELHSLLSPYPCFLLQGTLLGAYRDGGFTPTERDIDIGFLCEDLIVYGPQIAAMLVAVGYEVITVNRPFTRLRVIKAIKNDIKVDLIGMIRWKDKRFCCSNLTEYSIVHDATLLEHYVRVDLFGQSWRAPHDIEKYLELEYGLDWRTPKYDHVSKTRVDKFRRRHKVPNDLLERVYGNQATS